MAAIKHDIDVQQKMLIAQNNEKMSKMRTKSTNTNISVRLIGML
jgi:hypothetical protein